ncbi:GerAB/ArcD/ProY family transporter [Sporomusa malonica]|uniref:Spore germination protein n=1 Tax=Sporomusa malonica TaxID=112901 RepID=A0A1W2E4Y9_9FIRM|nr:endospore germination permease [Sporomusa malonica]SMD04537.1 spore germination protein [Sporomusa malonica]
MTVSIMANLEVKSKMSVRQFGVVMVSIMLGAQFVGLPTQLVPLAGQLAWVSVILGGGLFFGATWIMLKLADLYPNSDLTEYLPRLLGKWLGVGVIGVLVLLILVVTWVTQNQFSRVLVFFMFDRTPTDVIIMSMLAVVAYCALQDLGTIVRVAQFTFLVAVAMIGAIWSVGIFNFQPENLLPFWTNKPIGVLQATLSTWGTYGGYEIILLLFPLISQKRNKLVKVVGFGFIFITLVSVIVVVMTVGVITAETVKNESYPTLVVVRSVELPGTFIERLENYFLIAWIPLIFNSQALFVYVLAQIMTRLSGFADHRPWVLALVPLIYTGATLLDGLELSALAGKVLTLLGGVFSLGIIPLVYLYAKWKNQGVTAGER